MFLFSDYSTQLNASRIKYLQAQDDVVTSMKASAAKDLLRVSNDKNNYKKLLKSLIIEVYISVIHSPLDITSPYHYIILLLTEFAALERAISAAEMQRDGQEGC